MIYVHLSSRFNSTIFTNCCDAAINDDQGVCPRCKAEVYPGKEASTHQRSMARWNWSYSRDHRSAQKARQP